MTTAVDLPAMSEHDARKLTERIRVTAHNYTEAKAKLLELVQQAKDGGAHVALGYKSWTAYLAEVLGDEPLRLARDDRQEMVKVLSAEGMSTRAIAPIVGANHNTVARDLIGVSNETPEPPASVQGIDGKTYTRPEPQPAPTEPPKPKRRPITDQSSEAGWELAKAVERIERIIADDRLPANREVVTTHLKQHLINSISQLTTILNNL